MKRPGSSVLIPGWLPFINTCTFYGLTYLHLQIHCLELVEKDGVTLEVTQIYWLNKEASEAKIAEDATLKSKAEAEKLVSEAMAARLELANVLQKMKDQLADLKVSPKIAYRERG